MTTLIALFVIIIVAIGVLTIGIIMSADALNTAISQLSTDVQALIAQGNNSVPQAQVDAATANVTALDAQVKAALVPAA